TGRSGRAWQAIDAARACAATSTPSSSPQATWIAGLSVLVIEETDQIMAVVRGHRIMRCSRSGACGHRRYQRRNAKNCEEFSLSQGPGSAITANTGIAICAACSRLARWQYSETFDWKLLVSQAGQPAVLDVPYYSFGSAATWSGSRSRFGSSDCKR